MLNKKKKKSCNDGGNPAKTFILKKGSNKKLKINIPPKMYVGSND